MTSARSDEMNWLVVLLGAAAVGAAMLYAYDRKVATEAASKNVPKVRNAGRDQMQMPPRDWDLVDEAADASFPASDPPSTY
jgi:hypothetical protein